MRPFFFSLFFLASLFCHAQVFEGTVTYDVTIEVSPKILRYVTREQYLEKLKQNEGLGSAMEVTYKGNNYKIRSLDSTDTYTIYRSDSNRIYMFLRNDPVCQVRDAAIDAEEKLFRLAPTVTLVDTSVTVNGLPCKMVRVQWTGGRYEYYFSPGVLPCIGKNYTGHHHDGWREYIALAQAYPVMIRQVTPGLHTVIFTLRDIHPGPVPAETFRLPKLFPLERWTAIPGQSFRSFVEPVKG